MGLFQRELVGDKMELAYYIFLNAAATFYGLRK